MHGTTVAPSETRSAPRVRVVDRVRTVVVTVAGAIGVLCLLGWAVLALAGLSLVVVTTGSMTPTIPTGGLAVTHRTPAAEIRPGDVVTVPRAGSPLPVTHRVVAVDAVSSDSAVRSLTLRGDANTTDDRDPYVVRDAGLVVWHAPVVGSVLVAVTSPPSRGLAVAVVGVLVAWAFWPTGDRSRRTGERGGAA